MKHSRQLLLLVTVFGVLGCGLTTPAPLPTLVPIGTIVIQTAEAAVTQTAQIEPSVTLLPSETSTPSITPSMTPIPTATLNLNILFPQPPPGPTANMNTGGGNSDAKPTRTPQAQFKCTVVSSYPEKGVVYQPNQKFKAYWTIKNVGYHYWDYQSVDFIPDKGGWFHTQTIHDLPYTVDPGKTITITVAMQAPKKAGSYGSIWTLKVGITTFCSMKIQFEVE
ncbi:MAG: hypothetical protein JXA13_04405 [Anaerolineales bacterium]|nr:hypothetical protein [Anaerolineales bacterium]